MSEDSHITRDSWDKYFMEIAKVASTRGTCKRKQVGAVIVKDRTLVSTGYNGSMRTMAHCTEADCLMENGHCVRTVHAEANAIVQAAKNGVSTKGATIYTTAYPCWNCYKLIVNSGIETIVYGEPYGKKIEEVYGQEGAINYGLPVIPRPV